MAAATARRFAIKSPTDAWSGVFFIVLGGGAFLFTLLSYRLGSPANMGPGFFPALVGALVGLLGLALFARSVRPSAAPAETSGDGEAFGLRPLVSVLAAVIGFAILLRPFGLIVSLVVLVVVARLARMGTWLEMLVLTAVVTAIALLIFVVGLNMPFRVVPW
jgi:hypothetical protein